jgi:hypothetical protein
LRLAKERHSGSVWKIQILTANCLNQLEEKSFDVKREKKFNLFYFLSKMVVKLFVLVALVAITNATPDPKVFSGGRIVGGFNAAPGQYPYQVNELLHIWLHNNL